MLIGRVIEGVLAQLLAWFPGLHGFFALYYTCGVMNWADVENVTTSVADPESTNRTGYLSGIGQPFLAYLFALKPLGQLLNPLKFWWPILLFIGFLAILLSGFRSMLFAALGTMLIASYIRSKWQGIGRIFIAVTIALLILSVGNGLIFELPLSAQRSLSWLPGNWNQSAVTEARESTRWRTYMWEQMLTTDRYIQNKLLGDGFGFTKRQYENMLYFARYGTTAQGQENFMIGGNVHSGPVGSIRYGGYVGLALILLILSMQAREAWRIIRRAYPTPFRLLTLFVCIPIIMEPFIFTLIYGTYDSEVPDTFYTLGMLRMFKCSLEQYELTTAATKVELKAQDQTTLYDFERPLSV
jgi:hypothetical protein